MLAAMASAAGGRRKSRAIGRAPFKRKAIPARIAPLPAEAQTGWNGHSLVCSTALDNTWGKAS